jgi:threonine aldolase
MRFIGAQFAAMYGSSLWLELATHANAMTRRLEQGARAAGVSFAYPVEANESFPILRSEAVPALRTAADFYEWDVRDDGTTVARWVTSWDTTEQDVDRFCEELSAR